MRYLKILLIVFICGLNISSAAAQSEKPLTDLRQQGKSDTAQYLYDSAEVARIAEIILENEMMNENEKLYRAKDSLQSINRVILEGKINSLKEILKLKDEQLMKLEKTPLPVIDKSWKWWQYTLAAIGAVTFGFTAGVVYESLNR